MRQQTRQRIGIVHLCCFTDLSRLVILSLTTLHQPFAQHFYTLLVFLQQAKNAEILNEAMLLAKILRYVTSETRTKFVFSSFFGYWQQIKQTTLRQMLYDCMQPNYHSTGRTKCDAATVLLCDRFPILARAEHANRGRNGATVNTHNTTCLRLFPLPAFISLCAAHDTLRSTRSPNNDTCNFRRKQSQSMEPSYARCSPNLSRCQPLKGKSICHRLNTNWRNLLAGLAILVDKGFPKR